MKLFSSISSIAFILLISSCNTVDDLQPAATDEVPQSAVAAVRAQFPDATNLTFKSLTPGRVWQTSFQNQTKVVEGVVRPDQLVVAYSATGEVPDSVRQFVNQTPVKGGQFIGDYRLRTIFSTGSLSSKLYATDYAENGKSYTVFYSDFVISGSNGNRLIKSIWIYDRFAISYASNQIQELPQRAQQLLAERGLKIMGLTPYIDYPITVYVAPDGKISYRVRVSKLTGSNGATTDFVLGFDTDGNYLYADLNLLPASSSIEGVSKLVTQQLANVPPAIQRVIETTPEYAGTHLDFMEIETAYEKKTYRLSLIGNGSWTLSFDEAGNTLYREFYYSPL